MKSEYKCCGTCKWHFFERENQDWACVNKNAEDYTDFTEYDHVCEWWEERS